MKEEAFLRRRFSLCPPSSTPQKVDPRKLSRNLLLGGENDLYPLGPGQRARSGAWSRRRGLRRLRFEVGCVASGRSLPLAVLPPQPPVLG